MPHSCSMSLHVSLLTVGQFAMSLPAQKEKSRKGCIGDRQVPAYFPVLLDVVGTKWKVIGTHYATQCFYAAVARKALCVQHDHFLAKIDICNQSEAVTPVAYVRDTRSLLHTSSRRPAAAMLQDASIVHFILVEYLTNPLHKQSAPSVSATMAFFVSRQEEGHTPETTGQMAPAAAGWQPWP